MARRNEGILDILVQFPWWVSVIFAGVVYVVVGVYLPAHEFQSPAFTAMASGVSKMATFLAFVFLIPAPISAFNAWRKRKLLDSQKGMESIRDIPWRQFEELVAEAYRRQGYAVFENTSAGPDGGIDIRLHKNGQTHLVQCKQWRTYKIGVKVVRELYGVMTAENAASGIVVCSGMYTQEAKNFAADKPIDLVDGPQLERLIANVRVSTTPTTSPVNFPTEPSSSQCPHCGNPLVERKASKGKNAGSVFMGCSTFPKCRYTRSV